MRKHESATGKVPRSMFYATAMFFDVILVQLHFVTGPKT